MLLLLLRRIAGAVLAPAAPARLRPSAAPATVLAATAAPAAVLTLSAEPAA